MKLKHLTLRGFKSFADRTRIDFSTGVNVVVGPNGSGKSNILDAIAWVMGTQATKSLRTEKMEDVVFAGTATRPALSRAEVQLTFVNDDRSMPLDLAEITVTRRLFRDGTSEYELNGAPCRLLDIQELLSDGGIGRQQHVLVSQGHVGDVLNARPEDHRAVIEEAAGVTKHRSRRERAVRRLERTDHDVERLNDILSQQRKALRPLKRQANAAQRFDSVRDEARALRLFLGGEEIRSIRSRLGTAAVEREAALGIRDESDAALADLKERLERLRRDAGVVGESLTRDTAAAARLETVRERLQGIGTVAAERRRSHQSRVEGADERRDDLDVERRDLVAAIAEAATAEVTAADVAETREAALRALEDEERSLAEQIQLPTEGVVANMRGDLRALELATARDLTEREQVAQRLRTVGDRLAEESAEIERLIASIRTTDAATKELQAAYDGSVGAREHAQTEWETRKDDVAEDRLDVASASARAEAIEAALDGPMDAQAVDVASAVDGMRGSLVSALDVPQDMARAVDAVLGAWRGALVADGAGTIEAATSAVKGSGLGGVALVAESIGSPDEIRAAVHRILGANADVDLLIDRLGPGADPNLAATHLGGAIVVEGWKTGHRLATQHPGVVVVTPEGDVITRDGIVVAHPDGAGPAALEAARVDEEVAARDLQRSTSLLTAAQRSFDTARTTERGALEALEAVEAELAGFTEALSLVQRARAASEAERDRLRARISAVDESMQAREARVTELRDRVAEFEGEEAARQAAWDALNRRREEVASRKDQARKASEKAAADRASIVERRRLSEQRLSVVEGELGQLVLIPDADDRLDHLAQVEERAAAAMVTVTAHVETLRSRQRDLRERVGSTNEDLHDAEARRESLDLARRDASERLGSLDIELAELRVRLEAAGEALRRDIDASEDEALDAPPADLPEDADPHERLASLESDLRRMGPINPLAAAEYEQLNGEVEELERQLDDLNSSREDLRTVITALDDKMAALFTEAFDEIAALYHENFSLVFPGGTGSLRLTDVDNPLDTGVLVEAQPAGKKVGRLSLLSGGERSLAALAFLFAVFRARPSPFYVLDEVEAALDDANLHRFLRLVDTLRRNTQLVIITHQQQTMEAADVLYGVTMEPGSSSKVLSKRMASVTV